MPLSYAMTIGWVPVFVLNWYDLLTIFCCMNVNLLINSMEDLWICRYCLALPFVHRGLFWSDWISTSRYLSVAALFSVVEDMICEDSLAGCCKQDLRVGKWLRQIRQTHWFYQFYNCALNSYTCGDILLRELTWKPLVRI